MTSVPSIYVIIVAAGSGSRIGADIPKQYLRLGQKMILRHTLDVFLSMPEITDICTVINPAHEALFLQATCGIDDVRHCAGGETRQHSVYNGLNAFPDIQNNDIVLIHDAARPFVTHQDVRSLLDSLLSNEKAATLASPVADTMRYAKACQTASDAISRDNLWAIQTPQGFHYGILKKAHDTAQSKQENHTDDTALVSAIGERVKFVKGSKHNFKITQSEDLHMAQTILSAQNATETRTGSGFDVHAFDENAKEVKAVRLCGIDVPHDKKLKGHSDADVGLHTLTDAILGAIGAGDIGLHFPPSDDSFKNMDSAVFLSHAMECVREKGGYLINADITLICEQPKLGPYRDKMIQRVAEIMNVSPARVSIKGTTTEKLGFTGRQEGIAAQAVVSLSLPALQEEGL